MCGEYLSNNLFNTIGNIAGEVTNEVIEDVDDEERFSGSTLSKERDFIVHKCRVSSLLPLLLLFVLAIAPVFVVASPLTAFFIILIYLVCQECPSIQGKAQKGPGPDLRICLLSARCYCKLGAFRVGGVLSFLV